MKTGFTKFGIDKIYHFYGGLSLALLALFILLTVQLSGGYVSPVVGAVFVSISALLGGIAKDLYDALVQKEFFDIADVLWTWAGSVPIIAIWIQIVLLNG